MAAAGTICSAGVPRSRSAVSTSKLSSATVVRPERGMERLMGATVPSTRLMLSAYVGTAGAALVVPVSELPLAAAVAVAVAEETQTALSTSPSSTTSMMASSSKNSAPSFSLCRAWIVIPPLPPPSSRASTAALTPATVSSDATGSRSRLTCCPSQTQSTFSRRFEPSPPPGAGPPLSSPCMAPAQIGSSLLLKCGGGA